MVVVGRCLRGNPGVFRDPSFWDLAVDMATSDRPDADWDFLTT
ncbi:hypothetical protein ACIRYZ_42970 [Kitasatospora sp. NPDC101155]